MIVAMAWKSLVAHPVRTVVLGVGFGLGVSVMATLLGVGEVVLDQARSPKLAGGGDLLVTSLAGPVSSARFVFRGHRAICRRAASPRRRADLFLVSRRTARCAVVAHGGIPSLERALGDPETSSDRRVDRCAAGCGVGARRIRSRAAGDGSVQPVPDVPARADSWAEWLYFKGRAGDVQFYMTFLAGPRVDGRPTGRGRSPSARSRRRTTSYSSRFRSMRPRCCAMRPI